MPKYALNGWYSPKIGVGSRVFYYRTCPDLRLTPSERDFRRRGNGYGLRWAFTSCPAKFLMEESKSHVFI